MLNENRETKANQATKVEFTTDPGTRAKNKKANMLNLNTCYRTCLESDQYLPPESLVFIQFQDHDKRQARNCEGYIPAKVDWCFEKEDCYETALMFIDNICDQCNKALGLDEIYRTDNHNTLCRQCYHKLQGLKNSQLKKSIEKQLQGNVL